MWLQCYYRGLFSGKSFILEGFVVLCSASKAQSLYCDFPLGDFKWGWPWAGVDGLLF
jgi:hypothetical protein